MCADAVWHAPHAPFFLFLFSLVGVILAIDKPLYILQSPVVSETP